MTNEVLQVEEYRIVQMLSQPGIDAMILLSTQEKPGVWYRVYFEPNRTEPHFYPSGQGLIILMNSRHYERMVDLLRNESPVYLHTYSTGVTLSSRMEPVGEGELQP